ncbi:hypothetical protein [Salinispora tropica]|uniref:hypothetical protein n=1 Tax=Salinispora tropica TaxID=168695 RepID=UPI0011D1175F|nr:hypothetical protein [Salinispora tropica]
MLKECRKGHIFGVPVADGQVALGQVIVPLASNFLAAIHRDLIRADETDVLAARLDTPVIFAETMDFKIREGVWPILGSRGIPGSIRLPNYTVWVEPPGEYRIQSIDGTVGSSAISAETAGEMRHQKSYAPAFIEAALQALHGFRPWVSAFDEIILPSGK